MRNQTLLILSILIIILLAGCSAQEQTTQIIKKTQEKPKVTVEETAQKTTQEITQEKQTVKVETTEDIIAKKPEPTVKIESTPPQIPEKIQELITKSKTKIKSYQYLLSEPPENRFLNTYFVKGNKIKIKIFEENAYKIGSYYDTVYLDLEQKTATARCENERRCNYAGDDYTRKVFEADYDEFITKTPTSWLDDLNNAEIIGPEVVDGKSAIKIKSTCGSKIIEMWLHITYGVPIKVAITASGMPTETYRYSDMAFNHLKDSDVAPAFTTSQY